MAIPYIGKCFESTLTTDPKTHTMTLAAKAGSLICIALAGKRSGSALDITSITDSKGHVWGWRSVDSMSQFRAVAYCRITSAMNTSDTVTINWNGTPTKAWASGHIFEGASGTPTERNGTSGTSSTASETLDVVGSDWLTFASVIAPEEYGVTMTPINSSVSRDDNGASSVSPWCECFSRNGTTGATHTIGGTFVIPVPWAIVGVSFPFLAMPSGRASMPFLIGV